MRKHREPKLVIPPDASPADKFIASIISKEYADAKDKFSAVRRKKPPTPAEAEVTTVEVEAMAEPEAEPASWASSRSTCSGA